jgi:ribonuclease P protein component
LSKILQTIKKRRDFLYIYKNGLNIPSKFFNLQVLSADYNSLNSSMIIINKNINIGYTVTKKNGNAVVRNKIKRRLRALVQDCKDLFKEGSSYIFISKYSLFDSKYDSIKESLISTLSKLHGDG